MPQLIEKYRVQREAWMAQADELARLRDEVRGSAEREAMEIVTTARRDIRRIVLEARRELFVLSTQVQAALGEAPAPPMPSAGFAFDDDRRTIDEELEAFAQEEWGLAPRSSVAAVLEEARADMAILDQDARAVPAPHAARKAGVEEYPTEAAPPPTPDPPATQVPYVAPELPDSGARPSFPLPWVAGLGALAVLVIVLGIVWMLRPSGPDGESIATAGIEQQPQTSAPDAATPPAAGPAEPAAAAPQEPDAVRLSIEAVRPAWIRAVIDGRGDPSGQMLRAGETYEFTGRSIALRVGDAGAVRVSVNGGEARTLGGDGQVVNREFTLDLPEPSGESRAPAGTVVPQEPAPAPGETAAAVPPRDAPADALTALPSLLDPAAFVAGGPAPVSATSGEGAPAPAPSIARTASVAGGEADEPDRSAVIAAAERWLDAYQRQDQVTLAVLSTPGVMIADERPTTERVPVTAGAIARTLDRVTIRFAADTAVMTAVMTERAVNGGLQRSSPVSLVWVSNNGSWRLSQARLVEPSTLGRFLR